MTEQEAQNRIKAYVKQLRRNSGGWWIFSGRRIDIVFTRFYAPYPGETLPALRKELSFPHFVMNSKGLDFGDLFLSWKDIAATAIKTEVLSERENTDILTEQLVLCLSDGTVKEYMLGDTKYLGIWLGHYIETYKQEFRQAPMS